MKMDNFILGYALGLVLFVLCVPAQAETTVNIHLASKHIGESGLNEVNPGLGVEHKGWIAGLYKNSFSRRSVYAGREFNYNDYAGVKAGIVTGYEGGLSPMIAVYVRYSHIEVLVIPPSPKNPVTIGFGLRF